MREALERAWAHVAWANGRVGSALDEATEEGARDARRLFGHLVGAERVWLDRVADGVSAHPIWPPEGTAPPLDQLLRLAVRNVEEVQGILATTDDPGLDRLVSYTNSSGTPFETPLSDILLHVALHGSYHRGQIARALRRDGAVPVNTDYITFVREG